MRREYTVRNLATKHHSVKFPAVDRTIATKHAGGCYPYRAAAARKQLSNEVHEHASRPGQNSAPS